MLYPFNMHILPFCIYMMNFIKLGIVFHGSCAIITMALISG